MKRVWEESVSNFWEVIYFLLIHGIYLLLFFGVFVVDFLLPAAMFFVAPSSLFFAENADRPMPTFEVWGPSGFPYLKMVKGMMVL